MWGGSPEPRGASRPRQFLLSGLWRAGAALERRPTHPTCKLRIEIDAFCIPS
jgi:hypothetical protein